jgi:hypothetical protein
MMSSPVRLAPVRGEPHSRDALGLILLAGMPEEPYSLRLVATRPGAEPVERMVAIAVRTPACDGSAPLKEWFCVNASAIKTTAAEISELANASAV